MKYLLKNQLFVAFKWAVLRLWAKASVSVLTKAKVVDWVLWSNQVVSIDN